MKTIIKWIFKAAMTIISLPIWVVSGIIILCGVLFALIALYITNIGQANVIIKELIKKLK